MEYSASHHHHHRENHSIQLKWFTEKMAFVCFVQPCGVIVDQWKFLLGLGNTNCIIREKKKSKREWRIPEQGIIVCVFLFRLSQYSKTVANTCYCTVHSLASHGTRAKLETGC